MGNPLIPIGPLDVDIGPIVEEVIGCGFFPKFFPEQGESCQGLVFGDNCCGGFVRRPGDPEIIGGEGACPAGTKRVEAPGGGSICISLQDTGPVPPPPVPPITQQGNGQVQKICCPTGFKQKADGTPVCVKTRKTNFGNIQAARRAVRRLGGAQRALRSIEALVDKTVKPRKAPRARSARACKPRCSCQ